MITVLTSDENMLEVRTTVNLINYKILYNNATNNNNNSGNNLNPQVMLNNQFDAQTFFLTLAHSVHF